MVVDNWYWWTNAPVEYDYGYVETVGSAFDRWGNRFRLVKVHDALRFKTYQLGRYYSGLYATYNCTDSEVQALGLPLPAEVLEA